MNGLPYYKAYPRDFIEGTIGMSFELKAAYRLVLDLIYMQGGNLPDDARYISGLLGCTIRKWNSLRSELVTLGKIEITGEFLTNKRAVIELETTKKLTEKLSENRSRPNKNKGLESQKRYHTDTDTTSSLRSDVSERAKKQDHVSEAIEAYSAVAGRCGLPAVRVLNDARKRKLASLLKTHGLPVWLEALAKVEASDFCLGRKGDFRADLDFLLQQQSFTRLLEGRYDNRAAEIGRDSAKKPQKTELDDPRVMWMRLGQKLEQQHAEPDSDERSIHHSSRHAGHSEGDETPLRLAFARPS
ncbi:DUF1376 domain-containing protein [Brucella sp. NBRC 113783]|uniref:DUF1376 domain-containing protein n=1 Tax=Brucella sp. NBRC 113783 TaxID=3075478 RepID=UPI0029C0A06E|nr:DUF1376 domain-containing protein [Brucella sp. NBRC 113783]MDX4072531.1 DUF1376 domain-containing protein [Brucella sp. NBRC 113783]